MACRTGNLALDEDNAIDRLVTLRDGGPVMLTRNFSSGLVYCQWFEDERPKVGTFELSRLVLAEQAQRTWTPAQGLLLVADDNVDAADTLAMALGLSGYTVHTAYSGADAIREAQRFTFEAAILDLAMPPPDGYEVARQIRRLSPLTVLVALSGHTQQREREMARQAGFRHHVAKPADFHDLLALLPARAQPGH